jgi:predicted amidohydrolase YtcJ
VYSLALIGVAALKMGGRHVRIFSARATWKTFAYSEFFLCLTHDRAYTAARLKTLLDAGNTISLHSDTPVGPPRPLEWVWIAVNRIGLSGKLLGPDERISVVQAMKMITIDAAYTLGVEDKIGSIQAGKFADFTVLDQDPFEIEPMKLKDIPVWGTVLGGRVQPVSGIIPQSGLRNSQK